MIFKHFINGVEIEEPDGFESYIQEIVRDDQERVIRYNFPLDLTFIGDGYEIIEAQYQENFNSELEYRVVRIDGTVATNEAIGIIKISNCEFNLTAKPNPSVNVEIDDNVYQSAIFGNKNRPLSVDVAKSLNGVAITPVTALDITMFDSATGADLPTDRKLYDAFDVLRHAIQFISDGRVDVVSDWYSSLPSDQKIGINTGINLRNPTYNKYTAPIVTFQKHFEELWKKYNLYLIVEDILTDAPKLRLEPESYLYQDDLGISISNNDTIKRSIDYDKLFNRVTVGSDNFIQDFGITQPMYYTQLLTFVEEMYNIGGVIGVDNELNLVSAYVIDSNKISAYIQGTETNSDDDIFMVQYDSDTMSATKGDYFPGTSVNSRYYNEQLLNSSVVQRFDYLGELALSLGNLDALFRVSNTVGAIWQKTVNEFAGSIIYIPGQPHKFDFNNKTTPPNFDNGGNFDLSTDEFTAPESGLYRFQFSFKFKKLLSTNNNYKQEAAIAFRINGVPTAPGELAVIKLDSSGQPYSYQNVPSFFYPLPPLMDNESYIYVATQTIAIEAGDTVSVRPEVAASGIPSGGSFGIIYTISEGYFLNIASPLSGGMYAQNNPDDYYLGVYSIETEGITLADWTHLREHPNFKIFMDTGKNDLRTTYLKKFSRNIVTGESGIELVFNRNQIFK